MSSIESFKSTVTDLKSKVSDLKQEVNNLKNEVSNLKKEKPTKEKVDLKDRECNYCGTRGHTEAKSIVWVIYNHRKKSSKDHPHYGF